jgi:hypothetical protein
VDVSRGIAFFSFYHTFFVLFSAQVAFNLSPTETSFAMLPSGFVFACEKNITLEQFFVKFRATVRLKNGGFAFYLVFSFWLLRFRFPPLRRK